MILCRSSSHPALRRGRLDDPGNVAGSALEFRLSGSGARHVSKYGKFADWLTNDELTDEDRSTLDRVTELVSSPDEHFEDLRNLYESHVELQPGDAVLNYK